MTPPRVTQEFLDGIKAQGCGNGCHVCHEPFVLGEELGGSAPSDEHPRRIFVHKRCEGKKPGAYFFWGGDS